MIAEGDEEVEEELAAAVVHLELHGAAALEGAAAADDEGEVVGAQLGVRVGRIGIGVAGRCQDGAALDTRFFSVSVRWRVRRGECTLTKTLLSQGDLLQFLKAILLRGAVDDGVLQDVALDGVMVDGRLDGAAVLIRCGLQFPRVASLVVHQARVVIALV